jgi:hypothetical protein
VREHRRHDDTYADLDRHDADDHPYDHYVDHDVADEHDHDASDDPHHHDVAGDDDHACNHDLHSGYNYYDERGRRGRPSQHWERRRPRERAGQRPG